MQASETPGETIYVIKCKGYWYYNIFHIKLLNTTKSALLLNNLKFHFLVVSIEQHVYSLLLYVIKYNMFILLQVVH